MKAFKGMIRGYDITIHTDHLNLLYKKLPNQRVLRWRLLPEDFNPIVKHIDGERNLLANTLSRLEMKNKSHDVIIGNHQKQNWSTEVMIQITS